MSHNSRLEAIRCKEMAEKMINSEDYMGARDKLIQAKKYLPCLENMDSMLTVCDILSASSLEFPGCKIDYYWILQLKPSANAFDLRSRSQKLVSLLQPIKKTFPGTETALQLVKSAFLMLSDRDKRMAFDAKRIESWDSYGTLFSQLFLDKDVILSAPSEISDEGNKLDGDSDRLVKRARYSVEDGVEVNGIENSLRLTNSTTAKSSKEGKCGFKPYNFENHRKEEDFEVGQIWEAQHQAKFPHRYCQIDSKSNSELSVTWLKPVPFMENERRWCEAGFPVACGSFERDQEMSEEKIRGTKVFSELCSWVHGVTEERFEIYPKAGEVWAVFENWNLGEWSENLEIMNTCKFKVVEILTDYNKYVGVLVADLVKVEGFNNIFRKEANDGNKTSLHILPNNLYMFSHKIPAHRFRGGEMDRVENGMFELDPLALSDYAVKIDSFEENSSSDVSTIDQVPECFPPTRSHSNIQSVKLNWCRNDFSVGRVWAIHSGGGGMPRRYALINNLILNGQVRVTLLEPHPTVDYEVSWEKENLPMACGIFRIGKIVLNLDMSLFSHSVICQRSKNKLYYRIYPRKGEIWAMYTNWNKKWKQSDFCNSQYRVVEILEDISEGNGTKIARLVEVKGCMTFFQRQHHEGFELIRAVPNTEMLSFSHRIPSFRVPGVERYNIPESSLHLEPDALPPRPRK